MLSSTVFIYCFLFSALLIRANSMPFHVQPSTMAGVVKGLYSLRPGKRWRRWPARHSSSLFWGPVPFWRCGLFPSEWARQAPALFSGFIPQINPPALESLLPDYAAHDQKLQLELSMKGFPRSVSWARVCVLGKFPRPRTSIGGWIMIRLCFWLSGATSRGNGPTMTPESDLILTRHIVELLLCLTLILKFAAALGARSTARSIASPLE